MKAGNLKMILTLLETIHAFLKKNFCSKFADIEEVSGTTINRCYAKCPLNAVIEYSEFKGMDWDWPVTLENKICLQEALEIIIDSIKEVLENEGLQTG